MATKKMTVKKVVAKKPVTAMKKASPMKQAKKVVDSKETKEYIKSQAAFKDKAVKANQVRINAENKAGYSKERIDMAKKAVAKGSGNEGGVSINYRTGQTNMSDFDKKYARGGTYDKVVNIKTKQVAAEAKNPISGHNDQGFQAYLKPKNTLRMGNEDLRKQFVRDSISDRGDKEMRVQRMLNRKKIATEKGGMQTSEIGGTKKSPATQMSPTAKKNTKTGEYKKTAPAKMKKC